MKKHRVGQRCSVIIGLMIGTMIVSAQFAGTSGCGQKESVNGTVHKESVNGTVQDLQALILTLGGVSFTVPAKVLPTGVTATLSDQPLTSTDFIPAANETPITNVIKLTFSEARKAERQMTLRVNIPADAGPHFYGYVKLVGAPRFGSEFSGTTKWSLAVGKFDPVTRVLSFPFHTTAQEILLIVVKKTDAGAARIDPTRFLLAAKDLVLRNLLPSEALAAEAVCGDGNLDGAAGEVCDDGNTLGGDGCNSSCLLEDMTVQGWQLREWAVICDPPLGSSQCSQTVLNGLAGRFKGATGKIALLGFERAAVSVVASADLERLGLTFGTSGVSPDGNYLIAHLVPPGALYSAAGGVEGILGLYDPTSNKLSVTEEVLSEDGSLSLGDTIAHELFHAVQWAEIPWVFEPEFKTEWILEGTAVAVETAILTSSYAERRAFRRGEWRSWDIALNSAEDPNPYQAVEFWFEVADGDISYLKPLFVVPNKSNDYLSVDAALASLNIVPDIDPNLSPLQEAYLELIKERDSQPEYHSSNCAQGPCRIGQNCGTPNLVSLSNMSSFCVNREILPSCPEPVGMKQITLQVTAGDPNVWRLMLDGALHPPNTPISFQNNNPRIWIINMAMEAESSGSFLLPITSPDYPTCVCGDGILHPGEECDDHNTTGGDGCSSSCKYEEDLSRCPSTKNLGIAICNKGSECGLFNFDSCFSNVFDGLYSDFKSTSFCDLESQGNFFPENYFESCVGNIPSATCNVFNYYDWPNSDIYGDAARNIVDQVDCCSEKSPNTAEICGWGEVAP